MKDHSCPSYALRVKIQLLLSAIEGQIKKGVTLIEIVLGCVFALLNLEQFFKV